MSGRSNCCRHEPSLEELLGDEIMVPVLKSAGLDPQGMREIIEKTARRVEDRDRHEAGFGLAIG
jgi:hypothetical protein